MFFFEGKQELYQILYLLAIPLGVPVLMYCIKRKLLWISPFVAFALGVIITVIFYPYYITDLFTDNKETGSVWYWIIYILPVHCTITVVITSVLYVISRVVNYFRTRRNYMDYIETIESPTKGTMRVRVRQRDSTTVEITLLDGISAGYGFSSTKMIAIKKGLPFTRFRFILKSFFSEPLPPPFSRTEIYNSAKDFIEQLGPSGYLDDGP